MLTLGFEPFPVVPSWGIGFLCPVCLALCVSMCVSVFADYKRGFGGKFGVEVEKQDQCALGFDHKESLAKHESQKGISLCPLYPP